MQPFEMPEFYMPYSARCNPHLESARVHTKAWAIQMGILDTPTGELGSGVWDEPKFDAMDFASFAALAYPDASGPELDLLADWFVWAWFFDDFFYEVFTRQKDPAGGKEYVAQLAAYTPVEATNPTPVPTNPVEAGLANLWARTVPPMSVAWRRRFSTTVQNHLHNTLREVSNISLDCFPDPIEYVIELRRAVGGMRFAAALVEHALGVEIPTEIDSTRPVRVLKDAFADGADLRNDIFSYQKEAFAGEINGVMVAQNFLDCDLQRAVDVINDLATSRMQQFENTAVAELPWLVAEYGLGPQVLMDLRRYVKGLQDWMAGEFQWTSHNPRYRVTDPHGSPVREQLLSGPSGMGTSATRIGSVRADESPDPVSIKVDRLGLVRRVASVALPATSSVAEDEPMELPEFYMPFHARCNSHLDSVRVSAKAWVVEMGLTGTGLPGWDETSVDAQDIARSTALIYPNASNAKLDLITQWNHWGQFFADFFDEVFKSRRDLVGGKMFVDRLPAFTPIFRPEVVPAPTNLVERALADVWTRTAPAMSTNWRRWFSEWLQSFSESLLWEVFNLIENRVPDPVDYIEMRRITNGIGLSILMTHVDLGLEMTPEVYNSPPMRALVVEVQDWHGLLNDIFSYEKDKDNESGVHSGVLILRRFLDCDPQRAVALTNDLVTSRLRHFEHVVAAELPALCDEFGLDAPDREDIGRYVRGMQDLIAGFLRGHQLSVRYESATRPHATQAADTRPAPAPVWLLSGPTGMGTAAARIGSTLC